MLDRSKVGRQWPTKALASWGAVAILAGAVAIVIYSRTAGSSDKPVQKSVASKTVPTRTSRKVSKAPAKAKPKVATKHKTAPKAVRHKAVNRPLTKPATVQQRPAKPSIPPMVSPATMGTTSAPALAPDPAPSFHKSEVAATAKPAKNPTTPTRKLKLPGPPYPRTLTLPKG